MKGTVYGNRVLRGTQVKNVWKLLVLVITEGQYRMNTDVW